MSKKQSLRTGGIAALVIVMTVFGSGQAQAGSLRDWWQGVTGRVQGQTPAQPSPAVPAAAYRPVIVGMGDSVAAGDGLPLPAPPSADEQLCRRSPASYVDKLAATTGLQPVNLACSGASVWDGLLTNQELDQGDAPELKRTSQLSLAAQYKRPQVATVTIGANSVSWYEWLAYCRYATCGSENETNTFRYGFLAPAKANLAVATARLAAMRPETIVLTGYYDPAAGDTACLSSAGYEEDEIAWIRARLADLNTAIADVAKLYPNARFAPVDFGDRGICSANPLVQGLTDAAPLHPTDAGQAVIAEAVRARLLL